jgi:fibronectin type 3 domain-containing protein
VKPLQEPNMKMVCNSKRISLAARNAFVCFFALAFIAFLGCPTLFGQTYPNQIGAEVADRPTAFVDAFKDQGRLFQDASGNAVPTDANGNPTTDGIIVVFDNRPFPIFLGYSDDPSLDQPDSSGTYSVSFQGQATLSNVSGAPALIFANQVWNSATNTTTVDVTLPGGATYADGPALMEISFTNTQRTATSGTNTGITGLKAIRPGFAANTTEVFDPGFINATAPFAYLRFMGWAGTNTSTGYYGDTGHHLLDWSSRSLPTDVFQGMGPTIRPGAWGVSWEYILLMANAANKDIWINIPEPATGGSDPLDPTYVASPDTSSYIYNLALLLKNGNAFTGNKGLNPGLHIYLEHGNEVWNFGFTGYTWNLLAAEDEVNKGGSVLNNDGDTNQYDWAYRRHIKRVYEIAQIFQSVFGAGSLNTTIRPIYAWWALDEGLGSNADNALAWFQKNYGVPSSNFYSMALADYFGATNYANDTTIPLVLSDMQANSTSTVANLQTNLATATKYGLRISAYEGGTDNSNGGSGTTTNIGVQILANRDPGIEPLVENHIRNNFFAQGGSLFGYYALSGGYSRYGSWGATDDYTNLTTPKYEALLNLTGYDPSAVPAAPADLIAHGGNNSVVLTWQNLVNATSYNVKRSLSAGGEGNTVLANVTSPTYVDNAVTNGTTYYYIVTAVNASGESRISNEASATPDPTVPSSPTLTAVSGNGQATLTWTSSAGATSYNVYEGTTAGGESTTALATGVTGTSYVVTGLTNGSSYYFEVAAVNSIGSSANSNEVSATPAAPPSAPTGLIGTAGNAQVTLTWMASTGATSYNVYEGTAAGAESGTPIATGVTTATYTVTGLTNGTAYFFTVSAVSAGGSSGASNEATATPEPAGAGPGALLAYEPFGEATVALNGASGGGDFGWAAAWVEQNGSTAIPGYNIDSATPLTYAGLSTTTNYGIGGYAYQSAGRSLDVTTNGAFSAYLSNGLIGAPGTTVWMSFLMRQDANTGETNAVYLNNSGVAWYTTAPNNLGVGYFGSSSNDSGGNPFWSLQFNGTTIKSTAPVVLGQPALLVVSVTFAAGGDQVNLYVNPTSLGGAAPATSTLQYSPANSVAFQGIAYYGGDTTNHSSIADLRLGTNFASVTPAPTTSGPAAPTGVTATAGDGQVQIAWNASAGATSYQVWDTTGGNYGQAGPAVTGTSETITGLTNGTAYSFYVTAINSVGTSGPSSFASATPSAGVTIPAAPTGLTAAAGNAQAVLTWTASNGATSYNVYQGTTAGGESATPVATGITTTTYTALSLVDGTAYFFRVAAVNTAGTSVYSNEATAAPASGGTGTGTLLAYEPFGESAGTLTGASGGGDFGWGAAWVEQFSSVAVPGYDVATATPMVYTGLVTASNYAIGGYSYQSVGRQLDVSANGAFSSYLSGGMIGAPGTTVWLSFLLREDASPTNGQINAVYLNPTGGGNAWETGLSNTLGIGYFGSSSNDSSSNPFWSLQFNGTTVQSTAPVVQGATTLFVVSITYGAGGAQNQVNLYVNPSSLGGASPGSVSAQYSTASSPSFESISYEGGYTTNESSLDEIRVGTSFAAVTPATPVPPPAPTGLSAMAGGNQVVLSWTPSAGATSYNVYQGLTAGGESATAVATGITATTYTVSGLTNGTAYYFTVAAVNGGGTSGASNEASATPTPAGGGTTSISVPNYSFELDQQAAYIVPQDWILTTAGDATVQQISTNASNSPPYTGVDGTYYWSPAVENTSTTPYGTGTATLTTSSSLGTFAANTQYSLTVALGTGGNTDDLSNYQVGFQLLANGTPVATYTAPTSGTNAIPPGGAYTGPTGLADYSLSYSTSGQSQVVGQNITVALVYTYTGAYNRNAYFDNVRLTQTGTAPAPSISWQPAASMEYSGAPVGAGVLDASSTTPGTISYTAALSGGMPVSITPSTVLPQGLYTLTATLTPTSSPSVSTTEPFTVHNMNIFVANTAGSVASFYNGGTVQSAPATGGGTGLAVDPAGSVWSINANGNGLTRFNDAGAMAAQFSGGGMSGATALSIDGAGTVWVANGGGSLSAFDHSGTPLSTAALESDGAFSQPASVSVDSAGSLWVSNAGNNTMTEVIGVAVPLTTPLSAALK